MDRKDTALWKAGPVRKSEQALTEGVSRLDQYLIRTVNLSGPVTEGVSFGIRRMPLLRYSLVADG